MYNNNNYQWSKMPIEKKKFLIKSVVDKLQLKHCNSFKICSHNILANEYDGLWSFLFPFLFYKDINSIVIIVPGNICRVLL
jgi:hypothetical protein